MKWIGVLLFIFSGLPGIGQQAVTPFSLPNAADGNTVSLDTYSVPVVVIFTSNACAFDSYYAGRIKQLIDQYTGKFQFILINSHLEPAESPEEMSATWRTRGLNVPYLQDKDQVAMDALGARKSPEAFLLQKNAGKFFILYKGLIDDNPQVASDVKQNYLRENMDKLLARQRITVSEMRAIGCSIRRK